MGLLGAAGARFGFDFGAIWGSILDPQVRSVILVKNGTAPRREHDFEAPGGCQKGFKLGSKTASDGSPAPRPSGGPPEPHFGPSWGPLGEPKWSPKPLPKQEPNSSHFGASPGTPQAGKYYPPRGGNATWLGARGEITEGGTKPPKV